MSPRSMEWSWRFYIENSRCYEDEDSMSTWRIVTLKKTKDFKIVLPYALYRKVFTLSAFCDSNDASCVLVCFRLRIFIMLVWPCAVECFVIMNLSDLVLCNDCSFNESRGEIPIKGGSLSHPKNSILGCE